MTISLRTAGIWISDDHILLESLADRELWGIPGGSVEPGETIENACVREYTEETGLTIECNRLALVHENFWTDSGQSIQEYCFYFLINPVGDLEQQPVIHSIEGHLKFKWFSLENLRKIDFIPQVLIDYLKNLPGETVFFSSKENM